MPSRPLRPCAKHGCRALVQLPDRYCTAHQEYAKAKEAEAWQHYDDKRRDQRARAFYHSPQWRATRNAVLVRDHYLCQRCLRERRITRADTVHHIEELRKAWHRRLDMANLEAICPACHNAERSRHGTNAQLGG